jgi:hypothetical protein
MKCSHFRVEGSQLLSLLTLPLINSNKTRHKNRYEVPLEGRKFGVPERQGMILLRSSLANNRVNVEVVTDVSEPSPTSGISKKIKRMASSGMLRRMALVRTDVSEERSASIIRVTIGELGTTLAVTIVIVMTI